MHELPKGANCPLPSPQVVLSVACASPVDVSALLVAEDGTVRSDADLVFYNAPSGPGVRYLPAVHGPRGVDAVAVDTVAVPADVARVVVTASLDGSGPATFRQAGDLVVTVLDSSGTDAVRFALPGLTTETALICAEVYRRGGQWKLRAVGQGYDDGLAGIAREFGVDVEDAREPPSAAPPLAAPAPVSVPAPAAAGGPPPTASRPGPDRGGVPLQQGETVSLGSSGGPALQTVAMRLGWEPAPGRDAVDLEASVIAFDGDGRDVDQVWAMSEQGCGGAVRHIGADQAGPGDGRVITVDLSRLPPQVRALVFTLTSSSGRRADVASACCRLLDDRGEALARFDLAGSAPVSGVLMCKLVLQAPGTWQMTALGQLVKGRTVRSMVRPARAVL